MNGSITEKILRDHLVSGELAAGHEIGIRIDQTLTQDATGTLAYLQFEALGLDRIRCELAVSYVDHNTIQAGPENADDHLYLRTAAARYGAVFSKPGNGICHQLHLERFGLPGKTLLGSDSHTPTAGALGMLAFGAGGLDVAVAMGGGPFFMETPRVIRVWLKGRLSAWVSAKDVILKILQLFGTQGNVGCVLEYDGPGLRSLDVPERATIANMGAECGVTTSVFPSDDLTRRFLEAQGRAEGWRPLCADPDAQYERTVELNLTDVEPMLAQPHSPGNVAPVRELSGTRVDQVLIGSCTNSSYRDLKTVAWILRGRKIHPEVSVGIAPGSRQVLTRLAREGLLADLLAAGVRLLENACGFCIGNSLAPPSGGVSLRTSNRNFEGRCGTPDARVYLVSPETAAMAALYGRIVDPRTLLELKPPRVRMPAHFETDDSLFVFPPSDGSAVTVVRGPHMGPVPRNAPLPDRLDGVVTITVGDRITTDHIMPAGPRLKYRSNVARYAEFVFERVDPTFARRAAAHRDAGLHNFIVAGESYGQGSSREHAALCPMFLGVKAVLARSFERIHRANLINFGIVPLVFDRSAEGDRLNVGDRLVMDNVRASIAGDGRIIARNVTQGVDIGLRARMTDREKRVVLAGGLLNTVVEGGAA